MSASTETAKLTKKDKKLKKKQQKSRDMLEKHEGIQISEIPTKVLCVHNGGLDNGVSREDISTIFNKNGSIVDIIMLPRKPYSFICYRSTEDAVRDVEEFNGYEIIPDQKRKFPVSLYLSFVTKVPTSISPCNDRPPGLIILEDFISKEEEDLLVSSIQWKCDSHLKHREVKHYGYEFRYDINDVDADDPLTESIPSSCDKILNDALKSGHVKHYPDQLTVNKYLPGQGIPPHVDTPGAFEDGIMSLSLLSQVVMEFTHPDGRQLSVLLPRRSLLIMTGESRYVWSHGITPRKSDIVTTSNGLDLVMRDTRLSFTFRKIIHPKDRVNRKVPFQNANLNLLLPKSKTDAAKLENSHVQQVYEEIANHFSGTRHTPWPKISQFIKDMPAGSMMADIGCGNGKYLGLNKSIFEVGSDRSFNLSQICHERSNEVYVGDVLSIPLRSGTFDFCICIAVIHHMSTEERREMAVRELLRILAPGGKLLIYVWAMEQELHKVKSKYLKESKLQNHDHSSSLHKKQKEVTGNSQNYLSKDESEASNGMTDMSPDQHHDYCKQIPLNCKTSENSVSNENSLTGASNITGENTFQNCEDKKKTSVTEQSDKITTEGAHVGPCTTDGSSNNKSETLTILKDNNSEKLLSTKNTSNCPNCCLSVHKNRTHFQQQDILVPWERKDEDSNKTCFHRYYHVFKEGELEEMCDRIEECQLVNRYYDQGNWAVVLEKQ